MCLDVYRDSRFINGSVLSLHRTSDAEDCKMILFFFCAGGEEFTGL